MTGNANAPHDDIEELLPDYATGALEEHQVRAVERHLAGCERCRQAFAALLETTSLLVSAGSPQPEVRQAVMARVESGPGRVPAARSSPTPGPVLTSGSSNRHPSLTAAWATAALLLVAALVLGGWNYLLLQDSGDRDRIAGLITGNGTAHALTDSDFDTGATGVMYVNPNSDQALLVAIGLTPLPSDRAYQIWLFKENGQQVSAGSLAVDASGIGQGLVAAPEPFRAYHAVALSAEPVGGSSAPTSPLSLGGWIQ